LVDDAVTFPGQEIVGASGVGVGVVGDPPHAAAVVKRTSAAVCRAATPNHVAGMENDRACLSRATCPSMQRIDAKAEL
jgi:hypothetical protein